MSRKPKRLTFQQMLKRWGCTEATCHHFPEILEWIRQYKDSAYIPEAVLQRLEMNTAFDAETPTTYLTTPDVQIIDTSLEMLREAEEVEQQAVLTPDLYYSEATK